MAYGGVAYLRCRPIAAVRPPLLLTFAASDCWCRPLEAHSKIRICARPRVREDSNQAVRDRRKIRRAVPRGPKFRLRGGGVRMRRRRDDVVDDGREARAGGSRLVRHDAAAQARVGERLEEVASGLPVAYARQDDAGAHGLRGGVVVVLLPCSSEAEERDHRAPRRHSRF